MAAPVGAWTCPSEICEMAAPVGAWIWPSPICETGGAGMLVGTWICPSPIWEIGGGAADAACGCPSETVYVSYERNKTREKGTYFG